MEDEWIVDRARLRELVKREPGLSQRELATRLKRSVGWVQKWKRRLQEEPGTGVNGLWRRCSRRLPVRPKRSEAVVERVLQLREELPAELHRIPGPKALLYYLAQDESLPPEQRPRSTRTVWQILDEAGRIERRERRVTQPLERAEPLQAWQMDWKDATTVPPDPDGKQQHTVEILNVVDSGTSLLLDNPARADYNAETAILALAETFRRHGLPRSITCDRDPRFVASWTSGGFPSALGRFLLCLGVHLQLTPPHRPDKNPYVERFHRTLEHECLQVHRPTTLDAVQAVITDFRDYYNRQRPNQARSCGNLPPARAFPILPTLPPLPPFVDPNRWLRGIDGKSSNAASRPTARSRWTSIPTTSASACAGGTSCCKWMLPTSSSSCCSSASPSRACRTRS